ncbi:MULTISPECIES: DUF502 domain-containing protein [Arenibacter]|uniref:DUF502 domain-containing protein n=1 Tax=Arenibacter TaxID=178469 RepID=UPI0004DEE6A3|nr:MULTISPECIES: DUF502 domain-containing protein [Arenibacter]GBF18832.1 hypothetical protein C21_00997 [Arenibacter sp. NBRC 103722]
MKRLVNYFLQGLLYIAPLGITAYIIYVIFNFIDNLLDDKLEEIFKIDVPGLGFAVIFLFLVLVGIIGQSIFARPFKVLFKRIIEKAPLLKLIFSALNDLFSAFVGKEKKFNKPVMVLVNPISNLEKLGFLTEEDLSILDEKEKVAVYFPHSYNFSGELFIVPRNQVRVINVNPSVVMKFIISGGVSGIYEERETVNDIE